MLVEVTDREKLTTKLLRSRVNVGKIYPSINFILDLHHMYVFIYTGWLTHSAVAQLTTRSLPVGFSRQI